MEPIMEHFVKLFGERPPKRVVDRGGRRIPYGVLQARWDQRAYAIVNVAVGVLSEAAINAYLTYLGVKAEFLFYVTSTNVLRIKDDAGVLLTGPGIEALMRPTQEIAEKMGDEELAEDIEEAIFRATMGSEYGRLVNHASSGHIQGADLRMDIVLNHANEAISRIQRVSLAIARQQMDPKMLDFPKFIDDSTAKRAREVVRWIEKQKSK